MAKKRNNYSSHVNPSNTPQSEPLDDRQVKNNAGGFVYKIDKWQQLRRFIIIGTEGGTFYCSENSMVKANYTNVIACIKEDAMRVMRDTLSISDEGLAVKNTPAIFVMALAMVHGDADTKKFIKENLYKVCRIGTHLFMFADFCKDLKRGWGRGMKATIAKWYLDKPVDKLAVQVLKYQKREGWGNRDLLRLSHAKTSDPVRNAVFKWVVSGETTGVLPKYISDYELTMKKTDDIKVVVELIKKHGYSWEMVPTEFRKSPEIWNALIDTLGYMAVVRNLGNMSKSGFLVNSKKANVKKVVELITNDEKIKNSRIHPFSLLLATKNYSAGHGFRGSGEWAVVRSVVDALEEAYEKASKYSEPTGKRILIVIDVSGSMNTPINNTNLTCREASLAIASVLARREDTADMVAFSGGSRGWSSNPDSWKKHFVHEVTELNHLKEYNLVQLLKKTNELSFDRTDCALPMIYAGKKGVKYDAIVVITDNETWYGDIHPAQALKDYRRKFNLDTKLIVCGMVSTSFSIADPADKGMLDVVGFDASLPVLIDNFVAGKV